MKTSTLIKIGKQIDRLSTILNLKFMADKINIKEFELKSEKLRRIGAKVTLKLRYPNE